jgi:hypothetical protein
MQPGVMPQLAPDDLSGVQVFEGVQGCPISSLILKDILAQNCAKLITASQCSILGHGLG